MRLVVALSLLGAVACGGGQARTTSAADAVDTYITAVENDDPKLAYALLSNEVRKSLPFAKFEAAWKRSAKERQMQAAALDQARKTRPDLGARAVVEFKDGRAVSLSREATRWRLERALVGRVVASKPRDAVRALTKAVQAADFEAFVAILSKRKREALVRLLSSLGRSLEANKDHFIQRIGERRAQLFLEDKTGRYRVTLVREDGQWRVDDFEVSLRDEDPETEGGKASSKCDPADPLCGL
ncbi:MAG: hypothetical protein KJO07_20510 [Deltaproteobacteria bacterium]|nr:hypothetical protein [Deltaproteobacteria bacterium]